MRLSEILLESDEDALMSDIIDLLVAAKAANIDEMETEMLVAQLADMGHSVTVNTLLSMFDEERPEIIKNITANTVSLTLADSGEGDAAEKSEQDFEKDVTKRALQNIKRRAQQSKQAADSL